MRAKLTPIMHTAMPTVKAAQRRTVGQPVAGMAIHTVPRASLSRMLAVGALALGALLGCGPDGPSNTDPTGGAGAANTGGSANIGGSTNVGGSSGASTGGTTGLSVPECDTLFTNDTSPDKSATALVKEMEANCERVIAKAYELGAYALAEQDKDHCDFTLNAFCKRLTERQKYVVPDAITGATCDSVIANISKIVTTADVNGLSDTGNIQYLGLKFIPQLRADCEKIQATDERTKCLDNTEKICAETAKNQQIYFNTLSYRDLTPACNQIMADSNITQKAKDEVTERKTYCVENVAGGYHGDTENCFTSLNRRCLDIAAKQNMIPVQAWGDMPNCDFSNSPTTDTEQYIIISESEICEHTLDLSLPEAKTCFENVGNICSEIKQRPHFESYEVVGTANYCNGKVVPNDAGGTDFCRPL